MQKQFSSFINEFFLLNRPRRNTHIEGLRAFAIILVFNVHFFGQFIERDYFVTKGSFLFYVLSYLNAGMIGVDLFFVLSGFLLYNVLVKKQYTFSKFLINRLKRLLPVNLIVLIIIVLVLHNFEWLKFLLNVFFLQNFLTSDPTYNYVNWSLSWEWLFYICIFFSVKFSRGSRQNVILFSILTLFILFFNQFYGHSYLAKFHIKLPDFGRFCSFYIGVAVALIHEKKNSVNYKIYLDYIYLALFLVGIPLLTIIWVMNTVVLSTDEVLKNCYFLSVGIVFGLILYLTVQYKLKFMKIFSYGIFRAIGQISYSFYLTHGMLSIPFSVILYRKFISEINSFNHVIVCYFVSFVSSVIISSIFYYFLERPYMVKGKK